MGEPFHTIDFVGFAVEDIDEALADDFALALGLGDAGEGGKEFGRGIYAYDVESEAAIVFKHTVELVLAEHAVVDKYASEAVADGAIDEHGSH